MRTLIATACLAVAAVTAGAQAATRACQDRVVYFEFQVSDAGQPAQWIVDTTFTVHPTPAILDPPNLIQFVIDTLGVPVAPTFKALRITDSALVAEARRTFSRWRYTPAIHSSCVVRQVIQTPVGR